MINPGSWTPRRRRSIWTLILLIVASVTMIGPTQAVSGLISTSLNVLDFMGGVVDRGTPAAPAVARANREDSSVAMSDVELGDMALAITEALPEDSSTVAVDDASQAETFSAADRSSRSLPSGSAGGATAHSSSFGGSGGGGVGGSSGGGGSSSVTPLPAGVLTLDEVAADSALARDLGLEDLTSGAAAQRLLASASSSGLDPALDDNLGGSGDPGGDAGGLGTEGDPNDRGRGPSGENTRLPSADHAASPLTSGPAEGADPVLPPVFDGPRPDGSAGPPVAAAPVAGLDPLLPLLLDEPGFTPGAASRVGDSTPGISAVPEPATVILLSLGLAAAAHQARRRK